jgi:hypothetical protein
MAVDLFEGPTMSEPENIMSNAQIKNDGSERGIHDEGIQLFLVTTSEGSFWFEVDQEFAENRSDFWITIRNFGLNDRRAAGMTSVLRRHFTRSEVATAQARLRALFLGPGDNPALPYAYRFGKCVGVEFPSDWITIAY